MSFRNYNKIYGTLIPKRWEVMSAIVHEYYKLEQEHFRILLQIDPIHMRGLELIISRDGKIEKNKRSFDETIYEDLAADGFTRTGSLEFNMYLKGLGFK